RGIVISVPKGSYTPLFHGNVADLAHARRPIGANTQLHDADSVGLPRMPAESVPTSTADRLARRWWMAAFVGALIAAGLWGASRLRKEDGLERRRLLTVTSMPGDEEDPSLSPDGNFVAFSWDGGPAPDATHDIWIKAVDGEALRQLTNTPEASEH